MGTQEVTCPRGFTLSSLEALKIKPLCSGGAEAKEVYPKGKPGQMLPFPAALPRACRAQGSPALHSAMPQPQHRAGDTELLRVGAPQLPLCSAPDPPSLPPSPAPMLGLTAWLCFSSLLSALPLLQREEQSSLQSLSEGILLPRAHAEQGGLTIRGDQVLTLSLFISWSSARRGAQ